MTTPAVSAYSTTPANNVVANTGVTWDEGIAPASVNNSARQNMADLRSFANDLAWFAYGSGTSPVVVPAYASGTTFTIAGVDVTAVYHVGRRVRAVGSGTGTIYGTISAVAFSTNTTVTVIWSSGSLSNEALVISLSQSPATGGPIGAAGIAGTPTNDDAAAGRLGEYATANAAGVSLSNGTNANVTSVSLTPGDWDVSGTVKFVPTGATVTGYTAAASSTSATLPAISAGGYASLISTAFPANSSQLLPTPTYRITLAATTTVYLVAECDFTAGSMAASGYIRARRVR